MTRKSLLLLLALAAPTPLLAQTGTITGTVRDAASGAGIAQVRVGIVGAVRAVASNANGAFVLTNVPAGEQTIEFQALGYAARTQTVTVAAGESVVLSVSLEVAAVGLTGVVVVGSRAEPRTVTQSMVPVDVIPVAEIAAQAESNLDFLLRNVIPSYNVNTEPISDAATVTRPASMRGLASDHTLVLLNNKRRHRGAVITWLGGGVSDGAQGPDIGAIPGIALGQVEVLRDGASAQYGSDAIAGVMNFVLKSARSGGSVEVKTGTYYEGDGDMITVAGNVGLPLGETGFANLSVEYGNQEPTDRAIQRNDAAALIAAGNSAVRTPTAQIWGSPEVTDDFKLWLNTGYIFGDNEQVYAFGNVATKRVDGGFFFRNPNTRGGVFSGDGGETLLIGDVLDAKDGLNDGSAGCPVVSIVDNVPDQKALDEVFANPLCFSFQEMFPGGFTPQFGGDVLDASIAAGVKGQLDNGFSWDASASYGRNQVDFFIYNTVNAALGPETPTNFDPGLYGQEEVDVNLDFAYEVSDEVHLAGGVERREERFEIGQGQDESWQIGPYASQGFSSSSNGFPGFSPLAAGDWTRRNLSFYGDVNLGGGGLPWEVGAALRYETFSDFGGKATGKVSARFEVTESLALRAGGSTGFRAPTPGQQNAFNVSTVFDNDLGDLVNRGTIPSTSAVAALRGGRQLEPESSMSLTGGFVFDADQVRLTVDYFRIAISDRFAQTRTFKLTDAEVSQLVSEGITSAANLAEFRFFTNDFSTRTQGVDAVASVTPAGLGGNTTLNLLFNYTGTTVTERNPEVVDDERVEALQQALPNFRTSLSASHDFGVMRGLVRTSYWDSWYSTGDEYTYPGRVIVDVEASFELSRSATLALGANNLLNTFPEENPNAANLGQRYPEAAPFGFNGGYFYTRLGYNWSWAGN